MDERSVKLRRSELYEQVWTVPMWTLGPKYGLSDVGLAKICRKHNIPRPPRGYWVKKESIRKTKQIPLPRKDTDEIIEIQANPFHDSNSEVLEKALQEGAPKNPEERILVSEVLRNPHPLVKESSEFLKSIQPDAMGIIIPPPEHCLDIKSLKRI